MKNSASFCIAAALFLVALSGSALAESIDYEEYIHWTSGLVRTSGSAAEIAVHGQLACIALQERYDGGHNGLEIMDLGTLGQARILGTILTDAAPHDVAMTDTHVLALFSDGFLRFYDVTRPSDDTPVAELAIPTCRAMAVAGDRAYVAGHDDLLRTVDIQDPTAPTILNSVAADMYPVAAYVEDERLYVANQASMSTVQLSLLVFDLGSGAAPVLRGDYSSLGQKRDLEVKGHYVYLANGTSGLEIIDVSDPEHPSLVATVPLEYLRSVTIDGTTVVASSGHEVFFIDVTDPTQPIVVDSIFDWNIGEDVAIHHGQVVVTRSVPDLSQIPGISIIDLGCGTVVPYADGYELPRQTIGRIGLDAGVAVLGGSEQVTTIDVADPLYPVVLGSMPLGGFCEFIVVDEGIAYVGADDELLILRVPPLGPLAIMGQLNLDMDLQEAVLKDDRLYVVGLGAPLTVIDVSDPYHPVLVTQLDGLLTRFGIDLAGNYALVGCQDDLIAVVDISDPDDPVLATSVDLESFTSRIEVVGDVAYVCARWGGVEVLDITDPTAPVQVGSVDLPCTPGELMAFGETLYVNYFDHGYAVVDIAVPNEPRLIGWAPPVDRIRGLATDCEHLFVVDNDGLFIAPLHDATSSPIVLEQFELEASPGHVVATWHLHPSSDLGEFRLAASDGARSWTVESAMSADGRIWSADDRSPHLTPGRTVVYRLQGRSGGGDWVTIAQRSAVLPAAAPRLRIASVAPNPFNPSTVVRCEIPVAGHVMVDVYDLAGRSVATLIDGWVAAGDHSVTWHGRDDTGRVVAAGTYLVRAESGGFVESARVSLVK